MKTDRVITAMIEYFGSDKKRIHHFLKVYSFAKTIGESENLLPDDQELLEISAIVHDIGIKVSEEKYNSSAGKYQELEGPHEAEKLLAALGYKKHLLTKFVTLCAKTIHSNCYGGFAVSHSSDAKTASQFQMILFYRFDKRTALY